MNRRLLPLSTLLAVSLAVPAAAQVPPPPSPPPPPVSPPPPPPPPQAGKASFGVSGGLATRKHRYLAPGQAVRVRGAVKPYVPGQQVTVLVIRKGKVGKRLRAAVRPGRRAGRFSVRFKVGTPGRLRLAVTHDATPQQAAFRARDRRVSVVNWRAGSGARGTPVLLLQRALRRSGYATPVTGHYDAGTARAVNAFRKTNNLGRDGFASSAVYARLFRGQGAFRAKYPRAGRHVEFDWSRQVLALMNGRRPYRVYHASSGTPATPTVFGTYRFYRKDFGTNALGMVHSSYFIRGYAIHGYHSVPNYPASHGCIRVPVPNAHDIFRWIPQGMRIFVYV
ncbi:MAG TPA: L,D-transpeptidase family protein [Thermoleophilaceae bacterium]|nr:L,D-transpeptidase family protein [Thermoleophilaceae bacterium]